MVCNIGAISSSCNSWLGTSRGTSIKKLLLLGVFMRTRPKLTYDGIWDMNIIFNFQRGKLTVGNLCWEDLIPFHSYIVIGLSEERCQTLAKLILEF